MVSNKTAKLSKSKRTEIKLQAHEMLKGRSTIESALKYRKSYRKTGVGKDVHLSNGKVIRSIVHGISSIKNTGTQAHKSKLQQDAKKMDAKFRHLLRLEIKKIVKECHDNWHNKISSRAKKRLYGNDVQNYINVKLQDAGLK